MTVRVVTDSTSDIPRDMAREMNITVVPVYVIFGRETYRDRVDIFEDEFYRRLIDGPVHPTTSVPSPQDFASVYDNLAGETGEIISIHVSAKLSGTYNSAVLGARLVSDKCTVEVLDSMSMSMGLGMSVLAAAREAREGRSLQQVTDRSRRTIPRIHSLILADTLKYAARSGRINKAYGALGAALGIRALLGMEEGGVYLASLARTRARALERMFEFARSFRRVKEIALGYTTEQDDARILAERLAAVFKDTPIHVARVGPGIGAHSGPGGLGLGVREEEE